MLAQWHFVSQFINSHPWLLILLLIGGCVLIFQDLLTPRTWELTGTIGTLLLATALAALLTEHANGWFGILLLIAGLLLLLVEVHLLPGRGMAAILGLILVFSGLFVALDGHAFGFSVASIVTSITAVMFITYLPKSPVWKQLGNELASRAALVPLSDLIGQTGQTVTALRPMGTAEFAGRKITVVTEGEFIEPQTSIVVKSIDGERIVVDPAVTIPTSSVSLVS
jgi:membrane-bound ClpP family serine protease